MKKKRRSSKKTNLSTKKIIRKKKQAFHRKAKKHAKQMIALGIKPRTRHKKTQLAIPNLCPFKKDLLRKALRRRQDLKLELEKKKLEKKERKSDIKKAIENCKREREKGFMVPKSLANTSWNDATDLRLPRSEWEHKHLYYKELNEVISNSDVIIEVLDARDPMGCRSKIIEKKIICGKSNTFSGHKKLILLINKIDLIPSQILLQWMKILRREYPVIAFKASTQSNKRKLHSNIKYNKVTLDQRKNSNRCIGGQILIELLKKYSIALDINTPITVGFIGYPNTGKSSVINSLKRQQCVGTSSVAGFTTKLKEVKLDKMITLIDSPGVILNDGEHETRLVLRNALKLQDIDPIESVAHILSVANHRSLAKIYAIDMGKKKSFKSYEEFLTVLAFKINHLKSGGVPDLFRAAQLMINDWNHGKIPFYVSPPQVIESNIEVKFVNGGFAKEFDINEFIQRNQMEVVNDDKKKKKNNLDSYLKVNEENFIVADNENENDEKLNDNDSESDADMNMENNYNSNDLIDAEIMKTDAFINA